MFVRSSSVIVVDADAAWIRLVDVREISGQLVLSGAAVRSVGVSSDSAVLQEIIKGLGLKERRCAVVLPAGSAWVRSITPAAGEDAVVTGITMATRELPFSAEELCGAALAEADGTQLVAVVPRAALEAALSCTDAAGLRPVAASARSLALAAGVPAGERVLLVEVLAASTQILVVQNGRVCSEHQLATGLDEMVRQGAASLGTTPQQAAVMLRKGADADLAHAIAPALNEITAEAELQIAAQPEGAAPVTRVLLAGEGACVAGLSEQLTATLHLPAELMDPCAGISCQGSAAALAPEDRAALAAAIGAARLVTARAALAPDLLPDARRNARRWSPKTVAACALSALLLVGTAGAWWHISTGNLATAVTQNQQLMSAVKKREVRMIYLATLRAEKSDIDDRGRTIRDIAVSRVPWTRKLDELWQVTHEADVSGTSMWLNSLQVKTQDARATAGRKAAGELVSVQGFCLAERGGDPLQRFNLFHERLKSSKFFTGAFESINNPAGKAVDLQDGRSAWIVALDMQMALRTTDKSKAKPSVAKAGG